MLIEPKIPANQISIDDRFESILEQSPFSIQVMSPDGRIIRVNRAFEKLWGLTLDQLKDYNLLEDPQLAEKGLMPFIRKAFAGEAQQLQPIMYDTESSLPGLTSNEESQRWTRATIYPIKDAAGAVREVVLMHEDFTEQKRAEEKLLSSEARYRALFETTREGILVVDGNGKYIDVNDSFCRILKTTREKLLGSDFSEYMVAERLDEARTAFEALKANGVFQGDFPMRAADGSIVELAWYSRGNFLPGLHVCMAQNVTEKREAEKRLRESEERYRSLLENANDIIYSHDLSGRYLSINRAGEEITGWTREEILGGLNITKVVAPEHLELAKEMIAKKLQDSSPTVYELDIISKKGARLTLEVSTRVAYKNGEPVAVEGIARDVTERKHAEQEKARLAERIEAQRKHLQELLANVPGVVWEIVGDPATSDQRLDFISDYIETMLGYSLAEWFATPRFWRSIMHPEDRDRVVRESIETFQIGKGVNQFRVFAKDGRIVWLELQTVVVRDNAGKVIGMRGVAMDITDRKQKEVAENFLAEASTALSSSLDYQKTLATVAQLAVPHFADWCAVDIVEDNGLFSRLAVAHIDPEKIAWGRELYEKYPPDPNEPTGLYNVLRTGKSEFYPNISDEMLIQGARDESHLEILRQIGFRSAMLIPLKTRNRTLGVLTFVNSDSKRHHTPDDLALAENLANRAAIAIDNAKLFEAEQRTRKNAERNSNLLARLQTASTSLSYTLTPEQVAVAVVEQGIKSLGAHAGAVVLFDETKGELAVAGSRGFSDEIIQHWQKFSVNQKVPLADAVREKTPILVSSFENFADRYPFLGPLASVTGSRALVAFPLIIEGRTIGALGLSFPARLNFSEDDRAFLFALTQQCAQAIERARLYENEQQLREQAETANRLKDEFLATVSHELRTPLNSIVGWSTMLKMNRLDAEKERKAIETIERNAKAQSQIIDDLLDVSRIITGKMHLDFQPTELDLIIGSVLESFRPAAEIKGIIVEALINAENTKVLADAARIQQIVWNLISNAIKFTPEGGSVSISLNSVGNQAEIKVSDTGQGIKPEFLPFVFDRFRQADGTTTRKYGGLGLGLSIVRHLVEMHGGSVGVESEGEGNGASFTVRLPLMRATGALNAELLKISSPASDDVVAYSEQTLKDLRVLIVDDEADTRFLLTTLIEQAGAKTLAADSAKTAMTVLNDFQPDIIISDIGMPEEDGYSLIQKVREFCLAGGKSIPAIALSAYAREEDRAKALASGFHLHIAKPVNAADLIDAIKKLPKIGAEQKG